MNYLRKRAKWKKDYFFCRHCIIVMLSLLILPFSKIVAQEKEIDNQMIFTQDHPLVYEDPWDLWPFSFLEDGKPTGYSVEVMKMILEELDIPYEIKLKDSHKALEDLKDGHSDVMMGMKAPFHDQYGQYGKTTLSLFTHSIVYVKGAPLSIHSMEDLANNQVIVHNNSFSHNLMLENGWEENAIPFNDMKEAVLQVSTEGKGMILWNTMSLKWLLSLYQIDNLELQPIDMPNGEYRFMSNNPKLLALLDSTYASLRAQDKLQSLENKWFYPEKKETGIPSWIWTIANLLIISFFLILGYYIFYNIRSRRATRNIKRENNRLAMTLKASGIRIWTYDIKHQTITWFDKNGNSKREYTLLQFFNNYSPQDLEKMMQALNQIANQNAETIELNVKVPTNMQSDDLHDYAIALSVFHRDRNGKPTVIIGTRKDISQERQRQKRVKDTLIRYQAIFDAVMIDMVYFDKEGNLQDLNDKACHTFGCQREEILSKDINVCEFYGLMPEDLPKDRFDSFYATITLSIPRNGVQQKKVWYELKIQPLYDPSEGLQGLYGTGREVTETSRYYHLRQEAMQQLDKANKDVKRYMENINYGLKVGGMRFVAYSPNTHTMLIYSTFTDIQLKLTQTRAINLLAEQSRKEAQRMLKSMDNCTATHIDVTLKTILRQQQGRPLFVQFQLIPSSYSQTGEYFGICRDVSEQKNTEEQLEKETEKAQEIETIKNAFLHNMNYEIRTPLNSIVGFAEFFQQPHSPEDEAIFVQEIKNNSTSLLKLINNILFLSRIDANMIEIKTQPTDFALSFDSMCNTFWGGIQQQKNGVEFIIENHYEHMVLDIDIQNIGHILEQIISNAVKFTEKGSVRTRYDYTGDQLIVAVEDTGCGIPSELTDHIFERFSTGANNGTGLGLSICHELIRLMDGNINIKSEKRKGTTVWFAIPCKAIEIERKANS